MPKVQKMPAILFYTGDWLKDPAVRMLTLSQRGLWIDMLSLMYECSDRGYLSLKNGQPVSTEQLCRMVGCLDIKTVEECLEAMESVGVFSRTKDGVIYSRRMVNDEKIREAKAKAGRASGKSRNKKRTQLEQNLNKEATPLEYEYEDETVIEKPVVINSSERANSSYMNRTQVQDAWNVIPENRQRGFGKFQTAFIDNVIHGCVDIKRVKSALREYFSSSEGMGEYWRTPATLIEDFIWEENPALWGRGRAKESVFPSDVFEHQKIITRYISASDENKENYAKLYEHQESAGKVESQIKASIAFRVWNKYPEYRK